MGSKLRIYRVSRQFGIIFGTMAGVLLQPPAGLAGNWWSAAHGFRLPVTIGAAGYERSDKPADVAVNFTQILQGLGVSGSVNDTSFRVVEVDGSGAVIDDSVLFQFDRDSTYDASTQALGNLVVILKGVTPAGSTRTYHLYFDTKVGGFEPAIPDPQVEIQENVPDEGQAAYLITTSSARYCYHTLGGGFSSILDRQGNDWIGYHPTYPGSTAGGPSRGLPNPVYPRGYFHPGNTKSVSRILNAGPLKITLLSETPADDWKCVWEFYPSYARLTLLEGDSTFWFLYEGTPGGLLDMATDLVVRSDGTQNSVSESWIGDIPTAEWVYFADPIVGRSLFVAHHEDDAIVDSYRPMDSLMTVFGFGRQRTSSYMTAFPQHMTVGLMEGTQFTSNATVIQSAYRDLQIVAGQAERLVLPAAPDPVAPADRATGIPLDVQFTWGAVAGAVSYEIQASADSLFGGGPVVDTTVSGGTGLQKSMPSAGVTYFWRVRAANLQASGPWSVTRRFTTVAPLLGPVDLVAPENDFTAHADTVWFTWHAGSPGSVNYDLEVGFDSLFSFRIIDSTVVDTARGVRLTLNGHRYFWRVRARNAAGWGPYSTVRRFTLVLSGVGDSPNLPRDFELRQNYPNPFNPTTRIGYTIPSAGHAVLEVVNMLGERVAVLVNGEVPAGAHSVDFDAAGFSSGCYFYRLTAGGGVLTRRMIVLR